MKNVKQYERYFSNKELDDMAYYLSNIFFEECSNFGSEEAFSNKFYFYFEIIDTTELEQISKCKKFLPEHDAFYIRRFETGVQLVVEFKNFDQIKVLHDKLELHKKTKEYNL